MDTQTHKQRQSIMQINGRRFASCATVVVCERIVMVLLCNLFLFWPIVCILSLQCDAMAAIWSRRTGGGQLISSN